MQNSMYTILYFAQSKQKRKNIQVSTWICLNYFQKATQETDNTSYIWNGVLGY